MSDFEFLSFYARHAEILEAIKKERISEWDDIVPDLGNHLALVKDRNFLEHVIEQALIEREELIKHILFEIRKIVQSESGRLSENTRNPEKRHWEQAFQKKGTKGQREIYLWQIGVTISLLKTNSLHITSWIWTKGGISAEKFLVEALQSSGIKFIKGTAVGWQSGTVILAHAQLGGSGNRRNSIDAKSMGENLAKPFARINKNIFQSIEKFAKSRARR